MSTTHTDWDYPRQVDVEVFSIDSNANSVQRVLNENPTARVTFDPAGVLVGREHFNGPLRVTFNAWQQDGYVVTVEKIRPLPQGE